MAAADRFRIASVTKTFVATAALQLAAEGRLRLSDSLERWLPGLVSTGMTAGLTAVAGWIASYGVLRKKPLEILREVE